MLSRVADSLYWMNRYLERIDSYARFIEAQFSVSLEMPTEVADQWAPLIKASGDLEVFKVWYSHSDRHSAIRFLTFDRHNPNSIINGIDAARENARIVREWISNDVWEHLNHLYWNVKETSPESIQSIEDWFEFFDMVKRQCYLLTGALQDTLSDSEAAHFGLMGRFIERADKVTRILDVKSYYLVPQGKSTASTLELVQWGAILRSLSAQDMYRREHGTLQPASMAEFLILSASFPRSLRYSVGRLQGALHSITGQNVDRAKLPVEKHLGRLKSNLDFSDIDEVFSYGLHDYLDSVQTQLNVVGEHIYQQFFALTPSEF